MMKNYIKYGVLTLLSASVTFGASEPKPTPNNNKTSKVKTWWKNRSKLTKGGICTGAIVIAIGVVGLVVKKTVDKKKKKKKNKDKSLVANDDFYQKGRINPKNLKPIFSACF